MAMRPPLAFGGHAFRMTGEEWWQCACGLALPSWAIAEGFWVVSGRWCPLLMRALPPADGTPSDEAPRAPWCQLTIDDVLGEAP